MASQEPRGTAFYEPGIKWDIDIPELTLPGLLEQTADVYRDYPAFSFFGREESFGWLQQQVEHFSAGLRALGLERGERVALMLPNCPQSLIAFFGTLRAGGVVVEVNPMYTAPELHHQLADSGASVLVGLDQFHETMAAGCQDTAVRSVIVTSINTYMPTMLRWLYPLKARLDGDYPRVPSRQGCHQWTELMRASAGRGQAGDRRDAGDDSQVAQPGDLALLQYTGGTTGVPKGAMLSHRNLVANACQVAAWTKVKPGEERVMGVLPFFHVYGLTVCQNFTMVTASKLIMLPRFNLDEVFKAIEREQPTMFPGVPTMYVAMLNDASVKGRDLSSIHACISGAAPLPKEVQKGFEGATGGRLVEGYGLTEASPVTHVTPVNGQRKVGSIGVPAPRTQAKIVDPESGEDLPLGEAGELAVKGPQVMMGYWNKPAETERALRDGWLFTGDIAVEDEDGYFSIVDRAKDMIDASGFKVYPREVEEVLFQHPAVQEAAVVGVPDDYRGETVKAFVVLKAGAEATEQEIIDYSRDYLAAYKIPRQVEFRDELPKSMVGKVIRRKLLDS